MGNEDCDIFEGVEIVVHVPHELNPSLASSAYASFVFSRLGSVDRNGTHFAAHVSLMISLAARPDDAKDRVAIAQRSVGGGCGLPAPWATRGADSRFHSAPGRSS